MSFLTSAHVVPREGKRTTLFRPGHTGVCSAVVVWRGTPGGLFDAALLSVDDPQWVSSTGAPVRWGRIATRRTGALCEAWGAANMAQRPGKAVDTAHPSGTINPGDSFVANRYVMNVDKHPPEGEADGASPWGGMSGAALFAGRLLIGVIASDQAGFPHSRLAAVPAYVLWANPGFHAAMAEHAPQMCTALEPAELQHLHSVLPPIASVAELLEARRAVVPLRGRGEQLHELLAWATSPTTDSRLLHGPARHGKTRLAYELGSRLSHQGWAVLWLRTVTLATEALDALADTVFPCWWSWTTPTAGATRSLPYSRP